MSKLHPQAKETFYESVEEIKADQCFSDTHSVLQDSLLWAAEEISRLESEIEGYQDVARRIYE